MARFKRAGLYLVTSQAFSQGRSTPAIVKAALAGGARLIQLREKDMPMAQLAALATEVRAMTLKANALLIINDRLDLALAVGADGVHLGQDDLPVAFARQAAPGLIIGASTCSIKEALAAQRGGASYINIGPIFPTTTKTDVHSFLGLEGLRKIVPHVKIPFTVMGGIKAAHIPSLLKTGAGTIAVITAITAAANPRKETKKLLELIRSG